MNIYGHTDPGLRRAQNQDVFRTSKISDKLSWVMVCDGMGGAKAGDVASRQAADIIENELNKHITEDISVDQLKVVMLRSIERANSVVYKMSKENTDYTGMGTTVVLSVALNNKLYTAHVGDSRAYMWDGGFCRQITEDHSLVQVLVNNKRLDPEAARLHPQKNIITKCLGVKESIRCDFSEIDFLKGYSVILCSDGLGDYLNQETITEFFAFYPEEYIVQALFNFALRCGGDDNISIAAIFNT